MHRRPKLPTPVAPLRALALAACDASDLTTPPPAWLEDDARALAPAMPPDLSWALLDTPIFRWLRLASALDFSGDLDGARQLLDRLEERGPTRLDGTCAAELRALICARRGRLARQVGELDAAVDWYQEGLALSGGATRGEAWGACMQGLANAAQMRGDVDTAERLTRLVTMQGAQASHYARVAALLTRAVLHRQQGRLVAAARCAWLTHDLVSERDERRGMALNELSAMALASGQAGAARRGFEVVLSFALTLRVRRPARSGLLKALLAQWQDVPTDSAARAYAASVADALLSDVADSPDPWQRVHAQLDALEAYLALAPFTASRGAARHRARINTLRETIRGELATRTAQREPWPWAERRLAALEESARCHGARHTASAGDARSNDPQTFARLATLPLLDRSHGAPIGA